MYICRCNELFDETAAEVLAVSLENTAYNQQLLTSAKAIQASCAESTTSLQAALGVWQSEGTSYTIEYDASVCTDDDLAK
jgi:bacterioferritin-associated ferredoxin